MPTNDSALTSVQMASRCAQELADDLDAWKSDHQTVQRCWALEDKLTLLNGLIRSAITIETRRRAHTGPAGRANDTEGAPLRKALRRFSRACRDVDRTIRSLEAQDYRIAGAVEFQALRRVLKELTRLSDAGTNPRPVHVDAEGRIFELTGEPFTISGLEPEVVRSAIADYEVGNYRPLKDVLADRSHEL